MPQHSVLTGTELHEPKGVSSASSGTVYVADGSGSGSWSDPLASINNKNQLVVMGTISDVSTTGDYVLIPNPGQASKLVKVVAVCENNLSTADAVLTAEIVSAGVSYGSGTSTDLNLVLNSGAGVNSVFPGAVTTNNSVATSQAVWIRTDGGSTGASKANILCVFDVS